MNLRILYTFLILNLSVLVAGAQVGHWQLNNNYTDSSPNNISSGLIGTPSFSTDSKEGSHALVLNNTNMAVDLGTPSSFPTGNQSRTIAAWGKTSILSGDRMMFGMGTLAAGQAMFIGQSSTSLFGGGSGSNFNMAVPNFWTLDTWHHICLTYDGTTARLYADGVEVGSITRAYNLVLTSAFIGKNVGNSGWWYGSIDDVRVYDLALSASEVAALAAATPVPSTPTNLTATALSTTEIELTWTDNSTNETGFEIERSIDPGGPFTSVTATSANIVSYSDQTVMPGTTYYYRIRAINAGGNSVYSNIASDSTPSGTPPLEPSEPEAFAFSTSSIEVSWLDNSDNESGFEVERSLFPSTDFGLIITTAQNATFFRDNSLQEGTTYYYRVRAKNSGGFSSYTSVVSATTLLPIPESPSNLEASTISGSAISLTWQDNSSIETGFEIERTQSLESPFVLINTAQPDVTGYTDSDLQSGITYYYRVRSKNANGFSEYAPQASATTTPLPPNAPSALIVSTPAPGSVLISWQDNSTNETGFQLERSLIASGGFTWLATTGSNATSYIDGQVSANTTYYYRIRAVNQGGLSPYTATALITTPAPLPLAPSNVTAVALSPSSVKIDWRDNSLNELEFELERSLLHTTGFEFLSTIPSDTITYKDNGLVPGKTYYYRIRAISSGGPSAFTAPISITLPLENANSMCPNIFCDTQNGAVGIGTSTIPEGYKLAVNGKVMAEGVKVLLQGNWPDYVFEKGYKLTAIDSLKEYIEVNKHLPSMPPAAVVEKEGIDIERINVLLLEKIEELTLYMINMEERIREVEAENERLKGRGVK